MDTGRMVTTASRQPVALVVGATRAQLRRFGPAVEQAGYRLTIMKEAMSDAIQNVAAQPADLLVYNGSASVHSTLSRYRALPESPALVRLEGELAVPGDGFTAGEQVPLDPQQLESLLRGHLDRQNGHAGPAAPLPTNQPSPLREGENQDLPEPVSPPEAPVADDPHDQDELLAELAVLRQELNDLRAQIADERRAHAGLLAPGHQVAALSSQDMNGGQMEPANVQQAFAEQLANLRQEAEAEIAHLRQEAVAALTAVGVQVRSEVQNLAEATTARQQHIASLLEATTNLYLDRYRRQQAGIDTLHGALDHLSSQIERERQSYVDHLAEARQAATAEIERLRHEAREALEGLVRQQEALATQLSSLAEQEQATSAVHERRQALLAAVEDEMNLYLAQYRQHQAELDGLRQQLNSMRVDLTREQQGHLEQLAQARHAAEAELDRLRQQASGALGELNTRYQADLQLHAEGRQDVEAQLARFRDQIGVTLTAAAAEQQDFAGRVAAAYEAALAELPLGPFNDYLSQLRTGAESELAALRDRAGAVLEEVVRGQESGAQRLAQGLRQVEEQTWETREQVGASLARVIAEQQAHAERVMQAHTQEEGRLGQIWQQAMTTLVEDVANLYVDRFRQYEADLAALLEETDRLRGEMAGQEQAHAERLAQLRRETEAGLARFREHATAVLLELATEYWQGEAARRGDEPGGEGPVLEARRRVMAVFQQRLATVEIPQTDLPRALPRAREDPVPLYPLEKQVGPRTEHTRRLSIEGVDGFALGSELIDRLEAHPDVYEVALLFYERSSLLLSVRYARSLALERLLGRDFRDVLELVEASADVIRLVARR